MSWTCICGREHNSVGDAEDCCGSYVSQNNDDEE